MLLTTGERVSMALLSIAIHARGHEAISFTGSQSGILTNDRHFDARIIEVRPHRIEDELARGRIVIVAGYQGMSYRREITTLGRGGSDTTAVALAAALGAERCEIYSDVDGVYSADPRAVPDARALARAHPRDAPGDGRVRREGRLRAGRRVGDDAPGSRSTRARQRRRSAAARDRRPQGAPVGASSAPARSSPSRTSCSRVSKATASSTRSSRRRRPADVGFKDLSLGPKRRRVRSSRS